MSSCLSHPLRNQILLRAASCAQQQEGTAGSASGLKPAEGKRFVPGWQGLAVIRGCDMQILHILGPSGKGWDCGGVLTTVLPKSGAEEEELQAWEPRGGITPLWMGLMSLFTKVGGMITIINLINGIKFNRMCQHPLVLHRNARAAWAVAVMQCPLHNHAPAGLCQTEKGLCTTAGAAGDPQLIALPSLHVLRAV